MCSVVEIGEVVGHCARSVRSSGAAGLAGAAFVRFVAAGVNVLGTQKRAGFCLGSEWNLAQKRIERVQILLKAKEWREVISCLPRLLMCEYCSL